VAKRKNKVGDILFNDGIGLKSGSLVSNKLLISLRRALCATK
jgi:hypothetical protein